MEYVSNFGREREAENMSLEAYKERLSDPPKPRRGLDGIPRTTCTASAVLVFPVWLIHGTRRVCRLRAVEVRTCTASAVLAMVRVSSFSNPFASEALHSQPEYSARRAVVLRWIKPKKGDNGIDRQHAWEERESDTMERPRCP
jgi:hypothetical protein